MSPAASFCASVVSDREIEPSRLRGGCDTAQRAQPGPAALAFELPLPCPPARPQPGQLPADAFGLDDREQLPQGAEVRRGVLGVAAAALVRLTGQEASRAPLARRRAAIPCVGVCLSDMPVTARRVVMAFLGGLATGGTTLSFVPLVLTILGSAAGGAAIAGFFTVANAIRQRLHERQRDLDEARRLAYAQFISAASGFLSLQGKVALAPESDTQLRTAYGATVLLGSPDVRGSVE